jgi:vacuolar-type H+-ATPase subunit I/STV1
MIFFLKFYGGEKKKYTPISLLAKVKKNNGTEDIL